MVHIINKRGIMTLSGWTEFHPQMGDLYFHTDEFADHMKEYYSNIGKKNQRVDGVAFTSSIYSYQEALEKTDKSLIIPIKVQITVMLKKWSFRP